MSKESSADSNKKPPLPPGYHFTVSLCEVLCSQEQLDAIKADLVEVVRGIIHEYDLRGANDRLISIRVQLNRTSPLLDDLLPAQGKDLVVDVEGNKEPLPEKQS